MKSRKLLSVILAALLALSLCAPAFAADGDVLTRGEFVSALFAVSGVTGLEPKQAYFDDVEMRGSLAQAVRWAVGEGIVKGYGDRNFGPDDPVTREQMAAMLYRNAQALGQGFQGMWMFLLDYPDAGEISDWADEAMHWCVMNGIIVGTDKGLEPKATATDDQLALVLERWQAALKSDAAPATDDAELIDAICGYFGLLNDIPRPSKHEKQVSDFLAAWVAERGALNVTQDDVYNLFFELPATPGYEALPMAVLQAHMDMVCVAEEGSDYDKFTDPIKAIRDDAAGTLTADGTSLGGDDGIGVAIIMAIVDGGMAHGPLRVIFTVDEETGMSGVNNLDASVVADVQYLINLDDEVSDEVLLSTAAGEDVMTSGSVELSAPQGDTALTLEIRGLKGGHSGIEIDKGRLNGTVAMARLLDALKEAGVPYELASFTGGTADNAIPTGASAVIVTDSASVSAVEETADKLQGTLETEYAGIESGFTLRVLPAEPTAQVVSEADRDSALRYVLEIIDGVHTMSPYVDGLVESSSNLGIFRLDADGVYAVSYIRSSNPDLLVEIHNQQTLLAEACGFTWTVKKTADAWEYKPDNALLPLVREVYLALNGEPIREVALHAGLECGTFALLNPDLNMIAIGPDLSDVHSTAETVYLNSIPKTWRLLEGILHALPQT